VIITVVAMGVMQMVTNQIVHVIAVRNSLM
jgi:hypothetical protein